MKGEGVTWPHLMHPGVLVLLCLAQSEGRAEDQGSDRRRQGETCHVGDGPPPHCWAAGQAYVCTVNLEVHTGEKPSCWMNSPHYKCNDVLRSY